MQVLRPARHLQVDRSKRIARKKANKLKWAIGPTIEARKTKMLAKIEALKVVAMIVMIDYLEGTTTPTMPRHLMIQTILKEMTNL